MKAGYTHLGVLVDRSGSMASIRNDMVGGMNNLFQEQAKERGVCLVDYWEFNDSINHKYASVPVGNAVATLNPRGMTAFYDSLCSAVNELGERFRHLDEDERPENVIFVVVTDGIDNVSMWRTANDVKNLITQQQDQWNWKFIFLGANMDAISVAKDYGISDDFSITYSTTTRGVKNVVGSTNSVISNLRNGVDTGYTKFDREQSNV